MRLHALRLQNFRQHADTRLTFESGLTGIIGPNGSGKSTILEAIAWALYGASAARGKRDGIRNLRAEGRAPVRVELDFELAGITQPQAENLIERFLFASRWILAPFYVGLALSLLVLLVKFAEELWHIAKHALTATEAQVILGVLTLVDLALTGSLLVIVGNRGPLAMERLKQKSVRLCWEFMFSRSAAGGDTQLAQGAILDRLADLVEAGEIRSTLTETLSPISAATLEQAHQQLASGRTLGKIALQGWD